MPVIGQRIFILPPTTDKFVRLAGEEFTRQIDLTQFGNSWTKMRIAINFAVQDTGGGNFTNSFLFVGLCNGTATPYGSQLCTHALGYVYGHESGVTWTYVAGGGNPYYTANNFYAIRKVGVTETRAAVGSATFTAPTTAGALLRRGWLATSITQAATSATIAGMTTAFASVNADSWYENFLYTTGQGPTPVPLESAAVSNTQTISPGAGWNNNVLNTVNIYWSNTTYAIDIYAIALILTP